MDRYSLCRQPYSIFSPTPIYSLPLRQRMSPGKVIEEGKHVRLLKLGFAMAAGMLFTAAAQNNAEQVVFSATGASMPVTNNTKATTTPFGFWVWCSAQAAPGSKGGYPNANACQG